MLFVILIRILFVNGSEIEASASLRDIFGNQKSGNRFDFFK